MVLARNNSDELRVDNLEEMSKIRKLPIKLTMYVNKDKSHFMIYTEITEINYRCIKIFTCLMYT